MIARSRGGQAIAVSCDAAEFPQVEVVADAAICTFGRIATGMNDAAVAVYATFENTALGEFRGVMDVNFLRQVHGAKAVLPYLRREDRGTIIAISSLADIVAMPLHSAYAASTHAVAGFVEALRCALMADGLCSGADRLSNDSSKRRRL